MCEDKTVLSYGRKYGGPLEPKFEVNRKFCGHIRRLVRSVYTSYLRPRMSQGNSKVNMVYPDTGN